MAAAFAAAVARHSGQTSFGVPRENDGNSRPELLQLAMQCSPVSRDSVSRESTQQSALSQPALGIQPRGSFSATQILKASWEPEGLNGCWPRLPQLVVSTAGISSATVFVLIFALATKTTDAKIKTKTVAEEMPAVETTS